MTETQLKRLYAGTGHNGGEARLYQCNYCKEVFDRWPEAAAHECEETPK